MPHDDFLDAAEFFSSRKMECEEFASYVALALSGDAHAWGMAAKLLEKRSSEENLHLSIFFRGQYLNALEKLSAEGDRNAFRALVGFYEFSHPGFPANPAKAVEILFELARQGDPDAQFELFEKYLYGLCDLPQDRTIARQWLEKAAQAGHVEALQWAERMKEWDSSGFVYPKPIARPS